MSNKSLIVSLSVVCYGITPELRKGSHQAAEGKKKVQISIHPLHFPRTSLVINSPLLRSLPC